MDLAAALRLAVPLVYGSEGCELAAYLDTFAKPPVWAIGHGTRWVGEVAVREGMTCTRTQADEWAVNDLVAMARNIADHIIHVPVSDAQFAACLSLAYNIGVGAFGRSTVLDALNQKLYYRAADRFPAYDHAGGVRVAGLTARRERERALFLSGTAPAPRIPEHPEAAQPGDQARAGGYPARKPAPEVLSDADVLNAKELARERAETERLNNPETET